MKSRSIEIETIIEEINQYFEKNHEFNYANEKGAGFDSSTNRVTIFSKNGGKIELKKDRKDRIAQKIIDFVLQFSNQLKLTK